eukprot:6154002-Amphidinium_carterae.1
MLLSRLLFSSQKLAYNKVTLVVASRVLLRPKAWRHKVTKDAIKQSVSQWQVWSSRESRKSALRPTSASYNAWKEPASNCQENMHALR